MCMSDEFIEKYGQELFDEIFEVVIGDSTSENVSILSVHKIDVINLEAYGVFTDKNGKEISFELENGNRDGSRILDFGEDFEKPEKLQSIQYYDLNEEALTSLKSVLSDVEYKQAEISFNITRNKFEELRPMFDEESRKMDYDKHFSPTHKINTHYNELMNKFGSNNLGVPYVVIKTKEVVVDY
jgi:hypothetical protein